MTPGFPAGTRMSYFAAADLTETGRHLVQRDPDGAVRRRVIGVEGQELLAQQAQALLLPARLLLGVIFFFFFYCCCFFFGALRLARVVFRVREQHLLHLPLPDVRAGHADQHLQIGRRRPGVRQTLVFHGRDVVGVRTLPVRRRRRRLRFHRRGPSPLPADVFLRGTPFSFKKPPALKTQRLHLPHLLVTSIFLLQLDRETAPWTCEVFEGQTFHFHLGREEK